MAMIDVEGRTARMIQGKARNIFTKSNDPGNRLIFSDMGLAPMESHLGAKADHRTNGRKYIPTMTTTDAKAATGKKHIEVVHEPASKDAAKRLSGKFGLKKVPPPHRKSEEATVRTRPSTANETAEQRALRTLTKVVKEVSNVNDFDRALYTKAIATGGNTLINAAERFTKKALVEAAPRPQSGDARSRSAEYVMHAKLDTPYATSKAVADTAKFIPTRRVVHLPEREERNRPAKRTIEAPGTSKHEVEVGHIVTPYDTVGTGGQPYPEPPKCGVPVTLASQKPGKRIIGAPTDERDLDSVNKVKAESKQRQRSVNAEAIGMPDFIFGDPAVKPVIRRFSRGSSSQPDLLDHNSAAPLPQRPQGRFHEQKYKSTALW